MSDRNRMMMSECANSESASTHKVKKCENKTIHSVFIFLIFSFVLSTLFNPADIVFGLKIPLYVACWGVGLILCLVSQEEIKIPFKLLTYILLMIGIPVISIAYYYLIDGSDPFKGFELLKAYIFISFAMLIYITRIDILKYLCFALTMLAISILVLTAVVLIFPELFTPLYMLGGELGMFSIDSGRDYGGGVVLFQMYFVTSPMLTISIAYYFNLAKTSKKHKLFFVVITLLNICAMFVAGTRNNILGALILSLALVILYSRKKIHTAMLIAALSGLFVYIMQHEIGALFDPEEASNSVKLIMLRDYALIFSDPIKLIFGSGLGAYDQWTGRGFTYITELTYHEVIRNFGIILGGGDDVASSVSHNLCFCFASFLQGKKYYSWICCLSDHVYDKPTTIFLHGDDVSRGDYGEYFYL